MALRGEGKSYLGGSSARVMKVILLYGKNLRKGRFIAWPEEEVLTEHDQFFDMQGEAAGKSCIILREGPDILNEYKKGGGREFGRKTTAILTKGKGSAKRVLFNSRGLDPKRGDFKGTVHFPTVGEYRKEGACFGVGMREKYREFRGGVFNHP